jgi:hypothetical protein
MKTHTKPQAGVSASTSGGTITGRAGAADEAAAPAKKQAVANKPKAAPATKAGKSARRPPRSSREASEVKKLVCRYCGSDDLAPSFLKRRDARCRACFKQRYGSAARDKSATPTWKAKVAK